MTKPTKDKPTGIIVEPPSSAKPAEPPPANDAPKPTHGPVEGHLAPVHHVWKVRPSCDTCIGSYFPSDDVSHMGNCRRHAPKSFTYLFASKKPVMVDGEPVLVDGKPIIVDGEPEPKSATSWPMIFRHQWCVEDFMPKKGTVQ